MRRLYMIMAGALLIGAPMVVFIWHQITELLSGRLQVDRLIVAAVLCVTLFLMLTRLGRVLMELAETKS